jgi:hypothetical protein
VEGLGDLVVLSLATMEERECKSCCAELPWLEEGGGVFIPLPEKEPLQPGKSDIPV